MEYEKIKQLMIDMGNSKLTSIDIEFPDGVKIKMEKNATVSLEPVVQQVVIEEPVKQEVAQDTQSIGNIVKSPMVGTFYSKSSPTSSPYVEVGSEVKKGTVLCIVEAMKLMNEIESEFNGKIAEILVKDGEAVEYGQPLFRVV